MQFTRRFQFFIIKLFCHHETFKGSREFLLKLTFVFVFFFEIPFMSLSALCACEFALKVTKHIIIIIIVCRRQHIASYMCIQHVFMRVFDVTAASRAE